LLGEKINFVEDSDVEGETKRGDEANLVKIVFRQLADKFSEDIIVLREAKRMLAESKFINSEHPDLLKESKNLFNKLKHSESG